jgi:hypothetical protein
MLEVVLTLKQSLVHEKLTLQNSTGKLPVKNNWKI